MWFQNVEKSKIAFVAWYLKLGYVSSVILGGYMPWESIVIISSSLLPQYSTFLINTYYIEEDYYSV